jgi:hypothetical protein
MGKLGLNQQTTRKLPVLPCASESILVLTVSKLCLLHSFDVIAVSTLVLFATLL